MEKLLPENLQDILIRLNVRDLIRCKSVSKSWFSFISDRQFVKAHLNRTYLRDRNNHEIGHRRMVMCKYANFYVLQQYEIDNHRFDYNKCHLLGSCDGLVCISPSPNEIVVVNPSIREVYKLTTPQISEYASLCWGFGLDSLADEYKIVLGFTKGSNCTCFQVFSLTSQNWRHIGEVNYIFISRIGVLCKGALHWVAYDTTIKKIVIHSFHLSNETFVEIPQPHDPSYQSRVDQDWSMRLGTMEDCLCLFRYEMLPDDLWVMRVYNVKKSWEAFRHQNEIKYEVVHCIKPFKNYVAHVRSLCHETCLIRSLEYIGAPIYVKSIVSPHMHRRPKRKRPTRSTNTMRSPPEVILNNHTEELYANPHGVACHDAYVVPHSYTSQYAYTVPRALAVRQVYDFPHAIAGHHPSAMPHAIAGRHPNAITHAIIAHNANSLPYANARPHAVVGHDENAEAGVGASSSCEASTSARV